MYPQRPDLEHALVRAFIVTVAMLGDIRSTAKSTLVEWNWNFDDETESPPEIDPDELIEQITGAADAYILYAKKLGRLN